MIAQGSTDHTSKQIPLFLQQMTSKLSFVHRQERQLGLRLLTSAALVLKKSRARDWSRQNQGAQHVIVLASYLGSNYAGEGKRAWYLPFAVALDFTGICVNSILSVFFR